MSLIQRVKSAAAGALMLLCSLLMAMKPDEGYLITVIFLGCTIVINAIGLLVYYVTMAIHMVDGKLVLYKGILLLDLGLFSLSIIDMPPVYIMAYLAGCHIFSGVIDILRGFESRKLGSKWKMSIITGAVNIMIAIACIAFVNDHSLAVYIYCAGLVYNGIIKIIAAFRKTDIVYVQ